MRRCLSILLIFLLLLTGCAAQPANEGGGFRLWFISAADRWSADATALASVDYGGEETVPAVMAALLAGPAANSGLTSPIPAGTELQDWSIKYGVLHIDLSRAYSDLVGVDMTLADYCLTLTLTQLRGVNGVRITVNGQNLAYRDRQIFYASDVVFSGAEEEPVDLSVDLYFLQADSRVLRSEPRLFRLTESEQPALAALAALLAGPEDDSLTALLPAGVEVHSARVADGVCYADFSAALLAAVPVDEEMQVLVLSSVVETLCGLESVSAVQILVNGETVSHYGQVDISQPLEPSGSRP